MLSSPAVYSKDNIKVYYVIDGQAQGYNMPNLDAAQGFMLIKDKDGKEALRLFLNYIKNERSALTLIKFGDTKTDTIKADFKFEDGSVFREQVWLNGVSIPENFDIVK